MLRAAAGTEITQENTQDWIELDEGELGFQLLQEIPAAIFFIFIITANIVTFFIYLFSKFCLLLLSFTLLIRIIS
jgi:hypothetical protein